jgi:hypothetical protein
MATTDHTIHLGTRTYELLRKEAVIDELPITYHPLQDAPKVVRIAIALDLLRFRTEKGGPEGQESKAMDSAHQRSTVGSASGALRQPCDNGIGAGLTVGDPFDHRHIDLR